MTILNFIIVILALILALIGLFFTLARSLFHALSVGRIVAKKKSKGIMLNPLLKWRFQWPLLLYVF